MDVAYNRSGQILSGTRQSDKLQKVQKKLVYTSAKQGRIIQLFNFQNLVYREAAERKPANAFIRGKLKVHE